MNEKWGSYVNELAEKLENQNINMKGYQFTLLQVIVFAGAIVQLIASLLPMISVEIFGYSASANFFEGDGFIALGLVIATCVCVYLNKRPIAMGIAIANACLIVYDCFLGGAETYGLVKLSIGGYLLILTALVIVATCVISFMHHKNK